MTCARWRAWKTACKSLRLPPACLPRRSRLFGRIFSDKRRAESAAAAFAAKEAFLKAASTGLGGFALAELAVLHKPSGAPYFCFFGDAARFIEQNHLTAHLSLTHDGGLAAAYVILEQNSAGTCD